MKRHHLITGKLTALAVARANERGTYGDGHGIYLQVARGGSKSWVFGTRSTGGRAASALGPRTRSGLAQARERAAEARRQLSTAMTQSTPSAQHGPPPGSPPPRR